MMEGGKKYLYRGIRRFLLASPLELSLLFLNIFEILKDMKLSMMISNSTEMVLKYMPILF